MSTDEEPRHQFCPKGEDSHCFWQRALSTQQEDEEMPSHDDHKQSTFLSKEVAHKCVPVFRRMANEDLLNRLTHGGTQNTNECLNGLIWSRCPKTSFMGLRRVQGGVARAVAIFNEGSTEILAIMAKSNVEMHSASLEILQTKR